VVSEAAPGPVDSEFDEVAGVTHDATRVRRVFRITAAECARDIIAAFERGKPVIFPGRNYRWAMMVQPLMPRRAFAAQLAKHAAKLRRTSSRPR
jgi:uncharacterized protein